MIRALLDLGNRVTLLILNQSEEKTSSSELKARLEKHYGRLNLSVEVRRHPNYTKPEETFLSRLDKKYKISHHYTELTYHDALINNNKMLPPNFKKMIMSNLDSGEFDFAWFNYMKVKPSNLKKSKTKIIIDMHDMQSARVKVDVLPEIRPSRRKTYLKKFIASELKEINNCDIAVSISPVETDAIQQTYKPKAKLVTLKATDDPRFVLSSSFKYDITFIGSNSSPNVDGLAWFITDVMPIIFKENKEARFLIQGNINRNRKIKEAIGKSDFAHRVIQQGFVESLTPIYESSKVIICPIRYGTGMKIKVVEGMAYGKAIVGTPVAFEGIDISHGLICISESKDFADAVLELLGNPIARNDAQLVSRKTFSEQHSYAALTAEIQKILLEA
jgi:glycosyltransferase involved in cell wall biosynthesis